MKHAYLAAFLGLSVLPSTPVLAAPNTAQAAAPAAMADELIAADRAFSKSGAQSNLVDAIAAMFDEGVIVPTPAGKFAKGKAEAIAVLRGNAANLSSKAQWIPVRAGVSADGQHGFTYGFMTIRAEGAPDRRAKYLAYWVKRPEGWRVAMYKRAGSAPGDVNAAVRAPALPQSAVHARAAAAPAQQSELVAREKAFSDRAQKVGLRQAFLEFGSPDAMNMGGTPDFTYGNQAISAGFPEEATSPLVWGADEGALVAPSGDLGVTYGYIRLNKPDPDRPAASPFFTVWRRAGPNEPWQYVAE